MASKFKKLPELSVFFPAYNEMDNIKKSVEQALDILPKIAEQFEVIVVNDGSTDTTLKVAQGLAATHKEVKVADQDNKGYGGALKRGFKEARYGRIFFTDSDLQFDMAELKRFIKYAPDFDLIIGYRIHRAEGWRREIIATALRIWNIILLGFPRKIKDIDCAFKLVNKKVLDQIEPLFSDGAMISTELLLKAHKKGFPIKQIGVNHYKRVIGEPSGSNLKVIIKAVKDTFYLQRMLLKSRMKKS